MENGQYKSQNATRYYMLSLQPPVYAALVKIVRFNDKNISNTKKYDG